MLRSPWALLCAALLLSACATTPASRYYVLTPLAAPTENAAESVSRLGIGAISLPDYLNRPQLVIRNSDGRLHLRDGERWGEALEDSVRRVLGENLGRLLGPGQLVVLPAPPGIGVASRLQLEITAFDASPDREIRLSARWSLSRDSGTTALHESHIRTAMKSDDSLAMVAAMNEALLQLAKEIVQASRRLPTQTTAEQGTQR